MLDSLIEYFRFGQSQELQVTGSLFIRTLLLSVLVLIVWKVYQFVKWFRDLHKIFGNVQGPSDFKWISGNIHVFPSDPSKRVLFTYEMSKKYPRFYRLWLGPFLPLLVLYHPGPVKTLLKSSEPKPTGYGGGYSFGMPWIGQGLLTAEGSKWARNRRLLTPAFHFETLKPYVKVSNDAANILAGNIERYATSGEHFEVFQYICRCTLDIICRCAFSYYTDCQNEGSVHPYVKAVTELSETWWERARKMYLYPDCIFYMTSLGKVFKKNCDYVHSVAEKIIKDRKMALDDGSEDTDRKYLDFLDILLTAKDGQGEGMTLKEIRDEVDTFMFEGHDTTASAISWTLYSLAEHPEYQTSAQQEIDELLKDRETDDIGWEDLSRMPYLTMCLKEGLRHHAPVPFIQRKCTKSIEIEGQVFPRGTNLSISMYALHNNPEIWKDPMTFNPERFSPDNVSKMDSFQFVPFSAGPRNCIGQHFALNEEKVILAKLLRRFSFSVDPENIALKKPAAVMRCANGMWLYVKRRK